MAGIWYRAGTVAVTSGSTKVVGNGTTWRSGVYKPDKGHIFWGPDGRAYEVDYVESDTVLYLVTAYAGGSATGQAYSIVISITGQVPAFSRELSAFVAYHQGQMDGWQQLLTGTGDVTLTAPDGTKLTTPSWDKVMNAGYGVVAQAAAQAAIATSEAEKASASASAAAGAVEAAALPLPDLWAPLSNSLRLISGYGREIVVGDAVVASLANFSRQTSATSEIADGVLQRLKANAPAFGLGGLALEGQSTNALTNYDAPYPIPYADQVIEAGATPSPIMQSEAKVFRCISQGPVHEVRFGVPVETVVHKTRTASAWVKSISRDAVAFAQCSDRDGSRVIAKKGVWVRVVATRYVSDPSPLDGFVDVAFEGLGVGDEFSVWGGQLEDLPFATSLIETSGYAASRSKSELSVASTNFSKAMTIALEMSAQYPVNVNHGSSIIREPLYDVNNRRTLSIDKTGLIQLFEGSGLITCPYQYGSTAAIVARFDGPNSALVVNGVKGSVVRPTTVSNIGWGDDVFIGGSGGAFPDDFFGTVRNLRIFKLPLSDAQMGALI
ncbi:phage head spike fiber domain-containing protein [Aeromonas veronii]|uniref:phage head spike fiber domain-containing protein n=1 Tax=Aeromonas veronii TaxID=654 RepID=UPI00193482A7|nr:hypothetical protein [Aeromonas veronii]MBM0416298.1 hypothetical protein [Aeromonas veronii]MBW3788851.1 hypothetical protein [Aeromonas veronii]